MLNEMRLGHISEQTVETFKKMSRPIHFNDGLEVTELSAVPSPFPQPLTRDPYANIIQVPNEARG